MRRLRVVLKSCRGLAGRVAAEIDREDHIIHNWSNKGSTVDQHGNIWSRATNEYFMTRPLYIRATSKVLKQYISSLENGGLYEEILRKVEFGEEVQTWRESKHNRYVEVVGVSNLSKDPHYHDEIKFRPTVFYRSKGYAGYHLWSKPLDEFVREFYLENVFYLEK